MEHARIEPELSRTANGASFCGTLDNAHTATMRRFEQCQRDAESLRCSIQAAKHELSALESVGLAHLHDADVNRAIQLRDQIHAHSSHI